MKANSLTFFVFNNTYYIPTPAVHELGDWSAEPIAVLPLQDHSRVAEALNNRFQGERIRVLYEDAKKIGFAAKKFTKHKSTVSFVRAVDCWCIHAKSYGSAEYYLETEPDKMRGGFGAIRDNPTKLNLGDLINIDTSSRLAQFQRAAEYIEDYYMAN